MNIIIIIVKIRKMLEPVIIDPNGEEIKEKVIMSLTSFFLMIILINMIII